VDVGYLRLLTAITWAPPKPSLKVFGYRCAQSLQDFTTTICKYHLAALPLCSWLFLNCRNSPCKLYVMQWTEWVEKQGRYLYGNRNRSRNMFVPRSSKGQQQAWEKPVLSSLCAFLKHSRVSCKWCMVHLPLLLPRSALPFNHTPLNRSCPEQR